MELDFPSATLMIKSNKNIRKMIFNIDLLNLAKLLNNADKIKTFLHI